ncbi:ShlB/FhaC/HecB family hemolysin secretion/activation protein [uncultured Aquabacterium sp.]|uniref:ShlB/FhaC/HecB family hemolysin secretion/activation protein n=1 Tax=uncultured Aquabacterium sp. TaxID=158753 RepID=UPI0025FB8E9D|nr:ShlB/FhaC/HecB family hemolysin secretion/activation protein [uncultured Aquabacterium sp.]
MYDAILRKEHNRTHVPGDFSVLMLAVLVAMPASAQVAPDAGQVLREQAAPSLQLPRPAKGVQIVSVPNLSTLPGGATVQIQSVRFAGNTVLDSARLNAALGDIAGRTFDLAGLRELADHVTETYNKAGYPFARAYLPVQDLAAGVLVIEVIEGRYGRITVQGDEPLRAQAEKFTAGLKAGMPIESAALERAMLILQDQPGLDVTPVVRPGQTFGTGDLDVEVRRTKSVRGDLGYDNQGSRYTGEHRLRASVTVDSPFAVGDQIQINGIRTSEDLWLGSLGYSLPLGANGWRGQVGYAHTSYELGKEFASARASGTAKVTTLGASYPWLRSQAVNLTLGITLQHKDLEDRQGAAGTQTSKRSDVLPVSLQFDRRDGFGGGGVSYGSLAYTTGQLHLRGSLKDADASSGVQANGRFDKWNLDAARVQATSLAGVTLFGRVSAQWASKNLDSSERFGLGGANGIRAYPTGESFGDKGWLAQIEMRYAMGPFAPYAFYDAGSIRVNADVSSLVSPPLSNGRSLAGAGLGSRYQRGAWSADLALAWRTRGGSPTATSSDRQPQVWLTMSYRY